MLRRSSRRRQKGSGRSERHPLACCGARKRHWPYGCCSTRGACTGERRVPAIVVKRRPEPALYRCAPCARARFGVLEPAVHDCVVAPTQSVRLRPRSVGVSGRSAARELESQNPLPGMRVVRRSELPFLGSLRRQASEILAWTALVEAYIDNLA